MISTMAMIGTMIATIMLLMMVMMPIIVIEQHCQRRPMRAYKDVAISRSLPVTSRLNARRIAAVSHILGKVFQNDALLRRVVVGDGESLRLLHPDIAETVCREHGETQPAELQAPLHNDSEMEKRAGVQN
jgi:hypothetical protein